MLADYQYTSSIIPYNIIKMKLTFSLFLFSVIFSLNISAEDEIVTDGISTCYAQYLKSIGQLPDNFPSTEPSFLCRRMIMERIRFFRESLNDSIQKKLPNESKCILEKLDKNETVNLAVTVTFINRIDALTKAEKNARIEHSQNEFIKQMRAIEGVCGLEENKILSIFDPMEN